MADIQTSFVIGDVEYKLCWLDLWWLLDVCEVPFVEQISPWLAVLLMLFESKSLVINVEWLKLDAVVEFM